VHREDGVDDVAGRGLGEDLPANEHQLGNEILTARPRAQRVDAAEAQPVCESRGTGHQLARKRPMDRGGGLEDPATLRTRQALSGRDEL
jgi:hypothetical protein